MERGDRTAPTIPSEHANCGSHAVSLEQYFSGLVVRRSRLSLRLLLGRQREVRPDAFHRPARIGHIVRPLPVGRLHVKPRRGVDIGEQEEEEQEEQG